MEELLLIKIIHKVTRITVKEKEIHQLRILYVRYPTVNDKASKVNVRINQSVTERKGRRNKQIIK